MTKKMSKSEVKKLLSELGYSKHGLFAAWSKGKERDDMSKVYLDYARIHGEMDTIMIHTYIRCNFNGLIEDLVDALSDGRKKDEKVSD